MDSSNSKNCSRYYYYYSHQLAAKSVVIYENACIAVVDAESFLVVVAVNSFVGLPLSLRVQNGHHRSNDRDDWIESTFGQPRVLGFDSTSIRSVRAADFQLSNERSFHVANILQDSVRVRNLSIEGETMAAAVAAVSRRFRHRPTHSSHVGITRARMSDD